MFSIQRAYPQYRSPLIRCFCHLDDWFLKNLIESYFLKNISTNLNLS